MAISLFNTPTTLNSRSFLVLFSLILFLLCSLVVPPAQASDLPMISEEAATTGSLQRAPGNKWLNKEPMQAKVLAVYGNVELRKSALGSGVPLANGMLLDIDAEVESGANSGARFILDDGSTLRLRANSVLNFKRLYRYGTTSIRDTQIFLQRGQLESNVESLSNNTSKFEVVTPSAVTGVRGTQYRVAVNSSGQQTQVAVIEGAVAVASGGKELLVKEGFSTLAVSGQPPTELQRILSAPDLSTLSDSYTGQIKIALPSVVGAVAYRVLLVSSSDDVTRFDKVSSDGVFDIDSLPEDGYQLEARALDAQGVEGYSASKDIQLLKKAENPPAEQSYWLYRVLFFTGVLIVLL